MSHIGSPNILPYPLSDICNFGPLITDRTFDGGELGEANAKTHVVWILFCDDIICVGGYWRVLEKLE